MTTLPLLNWMLASTVLLGLLWLPYRLALRSERFFAFNRAYLVLAPLLAAGLPLLPASFWPSEALVPLAASPASVWLPTLQLSAPANHSFDLTFWLLVAIYTSGVAWGLVRLGRHLWQLARLTRRLPRTTHANYTLVHTAGQCPVSSFGRWVYWQEAAGTPTSENALLRHELAHVSRRHTTDRLLFGGLKSALWFNPFVYLFGRALEMTHEFQADADAAAPLASRHPAGPSYAQLLARYAAAQLGALPVPGVAFPLTHSFTHSPILTRLAMLKNSLPVRRWKQALVLPALAAVLVATACERQLVAPTTAPVVASAEAMQLLPPPPPMVAPPNANPVETAEQQPEYPGGMGQLVADLNAAIKYPAEAKAEKLQGRLFISFTVGADGRMYDAALKKGLTPSYNISLPDGSQTSVEVRNTQPSPAQAPAARALETEALRALQSLTKQWQPGRTAGKPVAVSLILPVQFAL
ncbi:M56 family metallopeptidase [Hymenobacter sp. ASUV-10]|uniref:M56 family metallopeptidase n=1 Tax=Hymenobacter aranciens TaxID=3063996 RepID=A0ABT9B558_9BACT|nr:M56 family metallopeptidase [Hymenobacter sp. ASUV-10]MDO7873412.1 M56 family metallopeptidase [Hymenobacter sp. ASUV-10]